MRDAQKIFFFFFSNSDNKFIADGVTNTKPDCFDLKSLSSRISDAAGGVMLF